LNPYAEYWMGDHISGPSYVKVDLTDSLLTDTIGDSEFCAQNNDQLVTISQIIKIDP